MVFWNIRSLGSHRTRQWMLLAVSCAAVVATAIANLPVKWVFAQEKQAQQVQAQQVQAAAGSVGAPTPMQAPASPAQTPGTPAKPAFERSKLHPATMTESPERAVAASSGCLGCHTGIEHPNMHQEATVVLGCTDCHGGNSDVMRTSGLGTDAYDEAEKKAHVQPVFPEDGVRGDHPVRAYTRWIKESYEFVKFADPGDLRVAPETCGGCHAAETRNVKNSMMTHGAMLWGAALYNNGAYPLKNPHFGEAYDINGDPARLRSFPPPTPEETKY